MPTLGVHSEVGTLRTVLVCRPGLAVGRFLSPGLAFAGESLARSELHRRKNGKPSKGGSVDSWRNPRRTLQFPDQVTGEMPLEQVSGLGIRLEIALSVPAHFLLLGRQPDGTMFEEKTPRLKDVDPGEHDTPPELRP